MASAGERHLCHSRGDVPSPGLSPLGAGPSFCLLTDGPAPRSLDALVQVRRGSVASLISSVVLFAKTRRRESLDEDSSLSVLLLFRSHDVEVFTRILCRHRGENVVERAGKAWSEAESLHKQST
jgi:hypothetical protein